MAPLKQKQVAGFKPSKNGFSFPNYFPGLPLPEALEKLIDTSKTAHGLCGGMCFTVIDHFRAHKPVPAANQVPERDTRLYEYLAKRQMASWGTLSTQVLRYVQWMSYSDEKAQQESVESWEELRQRLDDGDLTVIGLVYNDFTETLRVWDNHQVLAYGYTIQPQGTILIHVYDPNHPGNDEIHIRARPITLKEGPGKEVKGLVCGQYNGEKRMKNVHGFIVVPYDPDDPPDDLA